MNASRLADAMSYIDDDLLDTAIQKTEHRKPRHWTRWVAIAACFAAVIGTATAAANSQYGTKLLGTFVSQSDSDPNYIEYGFALSAQIKRFSATAFTGKVQEVPARIRWQIENLPLHSNQMPTTFLQKFPSAAEARKYLGLPQLHVSDWEQVFEETGTTLMIEGDLDGSMMHLHLDTGYHVNGFFVQTIAQIYTEHWKDDIINYRAVSLDEREYSESFYTTAKQLQCHIITSHNLENGQIGLHGFLVEGGILYSMNISYTEEKDAPRAEALLHQWAEQFGG